MKRNRILVLTSIAVIVMASLTTLFQMTGSQTALAKTETAVWGDPHVGFVINTTSGMGPEINQINAAWAQVGSWTGCLTCTYHLTQFRDNAQYMGKTQNEGEFGDWLGDLNAAGGGACADNTYAGLREFALNLPDNAAPADAIVFSDSPPMGNRRTFGFILDKMIENNIRVHNVGSALCNNENIPDYAMDYLALLTGGESHTPSSASYYLTDTLMAMNLAMSKDLLTTYKGHVNNSVKTFSLDVDSSLTTLGVDSWTGCLTCTLLATNSPSVANLNGVSVELLDPEGNVIDASTPGYRRLTSDTRDMQIMFETLTHDDAGEWQVRVSGTGEYDISVFGNSSTHMKSLGKHVARANKPFEVRALLTSEEHDVFGVQRVEGHWGSITTTLKIVGIDNFGTYPVDMFNIGMPPFVVGGSVTVPTPGLYRLVAEGTFEDGTKITRVDPTPIRIRAHDMTGSGDAPALVGSTRPVSFELVNDGVVGLSAAATAATTFDLELFSEQGWTTSDGIPDSVTLAPGESVQYTVDVVVPANAPIGSVEDSTLVAVPQDDLAATTSSSARTTVVEQVYVFLPTIMK